MNTVITKDNEIRLTSGLGEYSFGKTNYFTLLSEKGYIYLNNKLEQWTFENIKTFEQEDKSVSEPVVYFCGKNPLKNIKPLIEYFNLNDSNLLEAVTIVINGINLSIEKNIELPNIGAGGIFVDIENKSALFLPEKCFDISTNTLTLEEKFNLYTGWTNHTITGIPALKYLRAAILYKLLTSRFPYNSLTESEIMADIKDDNYLPIEIFIPNVDKNLSKEINKTLRLKNISNLEENFIINEELIKSSWDLKEKVLFSEDELNKEIHKYIKSKKSQIGAKRSFKKNMPAFILLACAIFITVIVAFTSIHNQNAQYTSKGLTSTEVIQCFFNGVNKKSVDIMSPLARGKSPNNFINDVTEIALLEKQIISFTKEAVFLDPAAWIIFISDKDNFDKIRVFGTTNLTIDGINYNTDVNMYKIKDKPEPVKSENGKNIKSGDSTTHKVEYYILQTDPENYEILIDKVSESYTLIFKNDSWIITDIKTDKNRQSLNTEDFKNDFYKLIIDEKQDIITAVNNLRNKYNWLPSVYDLEKTIEEEILSIY